MRIDVPVTALSAGLMNEPAGTHTSRTIMLDELTAVLGAVPAAASYEDYRLATVDENVTRKGSLSTRMKTFRHLRELYALSPDVPIFRALRVLWDVDADARPLLAALCAGSRDPLLRSTLHVVIGLRDGEEITPAEFARAVVEGFPGHYSPGVAARIGRNVASSWAQAGLLAGRTRKVRRRPNAGPAATAYALFLAHLCGAEGDLLFRTPWVATLDLPEQEVRTLAMAASRRGWIEYRGTGGMTEVTFRGLLPKGVVGSR